MRTDVMSGAGLAIYAEIALVLFAAAFLAIVVWIWLPRNATMWERASRLPLDDSHPQAPRDRVVEH